MAVPRHRTAGGADEAGALLSRAGFRRPTALQQHLFPLVLAGRDLIVEAPSGSGKTIAALAALVLLHRKADAGPAGVLLVHGEEALRKAQRQWRNVARAASSSLNAAVLGLDDGSRKEARSLEQKPDIAIASPQRLIDHIRQGNVELSGVRLVAMDIPAEAAEFPRDVEFILSKCPSGRQILAFVPVGGKALAAAFGGGAQHVVAPADVPAEEDTVEHESRPATSRSRHRGAGREPRQAGQDRRGARADAGDREAQPQAPAGDEQIRSAIAALVERMGEADAPELRRWTSLFRRTVPLRLRAPLAAWLARESIGVLPPAPERPPAAGGKPARLFINAGRNRRIFPNDIVDLFVSQLGIQRSDLGEVKVMDNYSFVEVQGRYAQRAIAELTGKELRGRKLTVDYARPREGKQRE